MAGTGALGLARSCYGVTGQCMAIGRNEDLERTADLLFPARATAADASDWPSGCGTGEKALSRQRGSRWRGHGVVIVGHRFSLNVCAAILGQVGATGVADDK